MTLDILLLLAMFGLALSNPDPDLNIEVQVNSNTKKETGSAASADRICPEQFVNLQGCCYFFSTSQVSWSDARAACGVKGGNIHLAEVGHQCCNDTALMLAISNKGNKDWWFGAKIDLLDERWLWQRTRAEFPISNPMWYTTDPTAVGDSGKECHNAGVWTSIHNRPYFRNLDCMDLKYFVCQIF